MVILSAAYFGPVQYFSKFTNNQEIFIEQYDNYAKQSYRNRCIILSANGPLSLTIPVTRKKGIKTSVKDIRINYDTNWQKNHIQSIISAYNSSPYFEYLRDEIEPFLIKKYDYLIDLDYEISLKIIQLLQLTTILNLSNSYIEIKENSSFKDYRDIIHPKKNIESDHSFIPISYHQVFISKFGFIPNLSILDLLFNQGNEARTILSNCNKG